MTLNQLFNRKAKPLVSYVMVGDGGFDKSLEYGKYLIESGVDVLELGIPFSDPAADGEVILKAGQRALKQKTKVEDVFNYAKGIREQYETPMVVMSYLNPIYQYGYDAFFNSLKKYDIEALIIPDLPYEEMAEISPYLKAYDIKLITMIALNTGDERLKILASQSEGFIYLVAVKGITGTQRPVMTEVAEMAQKIKQHTTTPVIAGFGIQTAVDVSQFHQHVDGVVIASQFIKMKELGEIETIRTLIREINQTA